VGDILASSNHAELGATVLRPFVSDDNWWMLHHHGIFQGYYFFHHLGMNRDMRDAFREHPSYARTEEFCRQYDSPAFDPKGESLPLSFFEPMLRRLFAQPKRSIYKAALDPK
jgi:predicted HD phosphohydrolase